MIRILFHIDTLTSGGAEKVLCNLVNAMDQTKFDITVQTKFPVEEKRFLAPGIRYRFLYPKDNAFYRNLYRAEAALGTVYLLRMRGDYDIECAYLECGPTKVIASSTNRNAKKVAWVHCDFQAAFGKDFAQSTCAYYKQYDKIACVSGQCKKSFDTLFGNRFDSEILYNVVDDDEIRRKAQASLPADVQKRKTTLCAVGRLCTQKNYPRLLKTCAQLRREGFDFDLWVLGDGPLRLMLDEMIAKLDLQDCVSLFGFQQNPYSFMKAADCLVCSSDFEGFSTFITEGVILQKPIVTTDCSGMHEILDGYGAALIAQNNDDAFCEGLRRYFLENESFVPAAVSRFTKANLVRQNELFFERLLSEKNT